MFLENDWKGINIQALNKLTRENQIINTAQEIISVTESTIIMNLRFVQSAMAAMPWKPQIGIAMVAADASNVIYDPALIIRRFKNNPKLVTRTYLHSLLHMIFHHNYEYADKRHEIWDMACDIAVENVIMELGLYQTALEDDPERQIKLKILKDRAGGLHAQALYRLFLIEEPSIKESEDIVRLFKRDEHILWIPKENMEISLEQWKKITERVRADLKSFSKGKTDSESMKAALEEAVREKIDYADFLRKFMTMGEQIHVNDDEFDYIYYTYGMEHYGNMPLVEPLEYADVNKIKEFVIAIDTSASCKGDIVTEFLRKTVMILSDSENFFNKYNVHILQCDSSVKSDTLITGTEDLERFISEAEITGYGSTDFRPVFEYVDRLIDEGELQHLKGLIYFTDGYGVYPEHMPEYDTAFVFLTDDGRSPNVPSWAIKVTLDEEQMLK